MEKAAGQLTLAMKSRRPVLRYHGGKWLLADWILSHFPSHRCYVEPFGGACSVLLQKSRSYAEIYNDLDSEVVNVFRVLRDPLESVELERLIRLTPFSREDFREAYRTADGRIEQARRTILRSFMGFGSAAATGFNTGFRSNSNRSGATPAHDWANVPDVIQAWTSRLQGVVIENKDALKLMPQHDSLETLFYVDPPYVLSTRKLLNPYCGKGYRFEMTDSQHVELSAALHALKGMVVLSGYPSKLYEQLYVGWHQVRRNAMADGASKRTEIVWLNEAARRGQRSVLQFEEK